MTFFGPDLRNGLPIGLGSVAGFGIAPRFSPASLFAGGVNGAWFDPSDSTTLFSDRAGTTPCGTPGGGSVVPVGLMLDKSQGLVLGSETVTNGDFSGGTTTGWTPQSAALSVVGGQLSVVPSTAFGYAYQTLTTVVGTTYRLTFNFDQSTAAFARYFVGTSVGDGSIIGLTTVSGVGSISRYFTATTTTTFIHFGAQNSSGLQALFDNISVRALPGNHAIAANDTTARPELRARVNLLTYSEDQSNGAWIDYNATQQSNVAVAPNGTNTADRIVEASGAGIQARYQAITSGLNTSYTVSGYAKADQRSVFNLSYSGIGTANWFAATFELTGNGSVTKTGAGASGTYTSSSITPVGNGWYFCTVTGSPGQASTHYIYEGPSNTNNPTYGSFGVLSYTGNTSDGVLVWGAQVVATNEFPANTYQRITDANTYDAVGFPRYFVANGTSSAMSTPGNVNLSGTDKVTVFAGVRKLSDAAAATLTEFSSSPAVNTGIFSLNPGDYATGTGPRWGHGARGTAALASDQYAVTPAAFAAPITNVLTGQSDIGASTSTIRANGTLQATATGAKGIGNFGSYPLFIGARNNTLQFFNGNIYSLIVVGSAVSAGQISATEQWVAGKVGITI